MAAVDLAEMFFGQVCQSMEWLFRFRERVVRVDLGAHAPACLLAMGSREAKRFHAGQGTELLCFLGRVVASTIKTWLNFPS